MDPFKELVWAAKESQQINQWCEEQQDPLLKLGKELFPPTGLVGIQIKMRFNHDTGQVVGAEVIIKLGRTE